MTRCGGSPRWRRPDGIGSAAGSSFHESPGPLRPRWWSSARRILGPIDGRIPLVAGTIANFLELNRARLPWEQLDGICFSAHPQEHASDNASLVENLEGLASAIESARVLGLGRPVEVGPITLRKRVNPYATGPAAEPEPGELPARVDPRQMSLFGAAWTLGAIKHLAEQRAARATFYETTGWLGVMESEAGPPLPERFPSLPGQVFPMFHVFADVNEFRGGEVLPSRSTRPLAVDGLVLRRGDAVRILLANFTPSDRRDRDRRPGAAGADPSARRDERAAGCRGGPSIPGGARIDPCDRRGTI